MTEYCACGRVLLTTHSKLCRLCRLEKKKHHKFFTNDRYVAAEEARNSNKD